MTGSKWRRAAAVLPALALVVGMGLAGLGKSERALDELRAKGLGS